MTASALESSTSLATHPDPLVRGAYAELTKGWLRIPISVIVSSFLFYYVGVAIGWVWLSLVVALELASAWARRGDLTLLGRTRLIALAYPQ